MSFAWNCNSFPLKEIDSIQACLRSVVQEAQTSAGHSGREIPPLRSVASKQFDDQFDDDEGTEFEFNAAKVNSEASDVTLASFNFYPLLGATFT